MNAKQLKKLIAEMVRMEVREQREDIIKEVKAELFDILLSGSPKATPVNESVQTQSDTTPQRPNIDRNELRQMFEGKMSKLMDGSDTVVATTNDVPPTPRHNPTGELPETFVGQDVEGNPAAPESVQRTMKAIKRDYGPLMKAMEKK